MIMTFLRGLVSNKPDPYKVERLMELDRQRQEALAENVKAGARLHKTIADVLDANDGVRFRLYPGIPRK